MRVLIDAVLFQGAPASGEACAVCADILREAVGIARARGSTWVLLDRGGAPALGASEVIPFPAWHAADAVADATLLQRMAGSVGAEALVSTALTTPSLLPTVHLLCGEDALTQGGAAASGAAECEIAIACSWAQICASGATADAVRSRFPRHRSRVRTPPRSASPAMSRARLTASMLVDAVAEASPPFADADLARRFLALRRVQAAFEISDG